MEDRIKSAGSAESSAKEKAARAPHRIEVRTPPAYEAIEVQLDVGKAYRHNGLSNVSVPEDDLGTANFCVPPTHAQNTRAEVGSRAMRSPLQRVAPNTLHARLSWLYLRNAAGHALLAQRYRELDFISELVFFGSPAKPDKESLLAFLRRLEPTICDYAAVYWYNATGQFPTWNISTSTHAKHSFLQQWASELTEANAVQGKTTIFVSAQADAIACPLIAEGSHQGWLLLGYNAPLRMLSRNQCAFIREISKRVSERFWQAQQYAALEHQKNHRQELAERVFHELNNPLSAMLMSTSQMMRSKSENGVVLSENTLDSLHQTATRIRQILQDLQQLHDWEANAFPLQKSSVGLSQLLTEVRLQVEPWLTDKGLDLQISKSEEFIVSAIDPVRISQVLVNLLYNAVSATPRGQTIRLRAERIENRVRFHVQDSGPGISLEESRHIFETRWRGTYAASRGNGLGLPIAKSIVEAHDGTIYLHPQPEGGAHFVVELPGQPATST